jgi:hypothetical protein
MDEREQIMKNIEDKLQDMFVEEYDRVNNAKDSINKYFEDLEINYVYGYNIFCVDFKENAKSLINNLSPEDLLNINTTVFVFEVLSYMIRNKIDEIVDDKGKKMDLILKHELKKYLINK